MKRLLWAVPLFVAAMLINAPASGQQLRQIVIDGTTTPPRIIQTNLVNADRPTITRVAKGVYTLAFRFDIRFFMGTVQRGGTSFDASEMMLTSVFATNDARSIRVFTYGFSAGTPTKTFPEEGRISVLVFR